MCYRCTRYLLDRSDMWPPDTPRSGRTVRLSTVLFVTGSTYDRHEGIGMAARRGETQVQEFTGATLSAVHVVHTARRSLPVDCSGSHEL